MLWGHCSASRRFAGLSPRAIGGLALLAACLLAGMLAMSLELYESAKDWQKSALQQDFARTLSAASAVLSTGLPNFFAEQAYISAAFYGPGLSTLPRAAFQFQAQIASAIDPGVVAIALVQRVPRADISSYLDFSVSQNGPASISSLGAGCSSSPVVGKDEYWPVMYAQNSTFAPSINTALEGVDVQSITHWFEDIQAAIDGSTCVIRRYTNMDALSPVHVSSTVALTCPLYGNATSFVPLNTRDGIDVDATVTGAFTMFTSADLIGTDASVSVPAYFSAIPPSTVVQIRASGPVPKSPFVPACPFMTFDTNPVLGNIYSGAVGTTISTISNQEFDDLLSATPADLIGSISLFVLGRTVTVTVIPQREFISAHESRDPNIILGVTLSTTLLMTALLIIVSIVMRNYTQVKAKHLLVQERERTVIAEAAQAAHESTLGYACHELRNPLHAISASAAFLAEKYKPGEEGYEDIQSILAGASQMGRLVNDVLDLSKLRAGKLQIQPALFPIRPLLSDIKNLHTGMLPPGVRLVVEVARDVPESLCLDSLRVHQVLSNGLTNAIKHTRKGEIMIRVFIWDIIADEEIDPMPGRRSSFDSPGVMNTVPEVNTVQVQRGIRFEVWDTGVGLGSINPDTLFEPFSQGKKPSSPIKPKATSPGMSSFIRRLRPESKGGSVRPYDVSASKGKERSLLPMSTMDAEQSKQTVLSPSQIAHNASARGQPTPSSVLSKQTTFETVSGYLPGTPLRGTAAPTPSVRAPVQVLPSFMPTRTKSSAAESLPSDTGPVLSPAGSGGAWGPVTGGVMQRAVSCAQPVEDFEKKALAAVVSHAKAGTGLGLPICKQLVKLMKGNIGLEERDFKTLFWFEVPLPASTQASTEPGDNRDSTTLPGSEATPFRANGHPPVVIEELGETKTPPVPESARSNRGMLRVNTNSRFLSAQLGPAVALAPATIPPPIASVNQPPLRCLVVDDEAVNRRLCTRMLTRQGCEVEALEDGDMVLDRLLRDASDLDAVVSANTVFDVVLMDIMMQRSNGLTVLLSLRDEPRVRPLPPFIAMTGNTSGSDREKYTAAGFADVLPKPFSAEDLKRSLLSVTARGNSSGNA